MHSRTRAGLVVAGVLVAMGGYAQTPPMGPEFQVNSYTTGGQGWASVAPAAGGGFVVTWNSFGQDGDGEGVFGQLFDAFGDRIGAEFGINAATAGWQGGGAIASDGTGSFVVVWTDIGAGDGSDSGVFGRLFDASGNPLGPDFQVNTYTTGYQDVPDVSREPGGNFVVVWESAGQDGDLKGIFGQRFDSTGGKLGAEFQVNTYTTGGQTDARVATDGSGNFVVEWINKPGYPASWDVRARRYDGSGTPLGPEFRVNAAADEQLWDEGDVAVDAAGNFVVVWGTLFSPDEVFARRYDAAGNPLGPEFQVNTYTTGYQQYPVVAMGPNGSFIVVWESVGQDGDNRGVFAQRFDPTGRRVGSEFPVNTYTTGSQELPAVMLDARGQFVAAWSSGIGQDGSSSGVFARRGALNAAEPLMVDGRGSGQTSNLNGVFEPGETVMVEPMWRNTYTFSLDLTGVAANFIGPAPGLYSIVDGTANYGNLYPDSDEDCYTASQDCYLMAVSGSRPGTHWDATFDETVSTGLTKTWTLHLGASFPDVPTSDQFYKYIENLLHNGVTGGCGAGNYCPTASVTRAQMAVFLLKANHGSTYVPPACTGAFADVACPSQFADWIEQLFHEGITGGCGGGNYCPNNPVTRAQMAAFLLKAEHGSSYVPPACNGMFADVTCPSLFANWIEQLAAEGITGGCGGGNYCPNNPNTRGQMAAFLVKTFGLVLYGP